ncbi:hypothetical protein MtrunA17_Chr6g0466931 [Medicago truncatula]|uniref:F-box protein interaction domain protein n=1 Tax=Medicago truncatula TaxID=3880 RepID=A0A396HK67_MEDTR|nr:hypothetical protein MtrunA17_Chr6g0466931 [Medicago truncatula]
MDCSFMVGSCNGLICFRSYSYTHGHEEFWFRFWNPTTNTLSQELGHLTTFFRLTFGYDISNDTYKVVAFSIDEGFVEVPSVEPSVTILMDCLCFSHRFKETHFVLWRMMEFGVQESWTQFLKISLQDLQIDQNLHLFLFPLYLSESDNTLIMAINRQGYDDHNSHAIIYNWIDKRVEQITSGDNEILWFYTKDFVESLISSS